MTGPNLGREVCASMARGCARFHAVVKSFAFLVGEETWQDSLCNDLATGPSVTQLFEVGGGPGVRQGAEEGGEHCPGVVRGHVSVAQRAPMVGWGTGTRRGEGMRRELRHHGMLLTSMGWDLCGNGPEG